MHCSLGPDGPWNKSAQAEADFQSKEVEAMACLPLHSDTTQAPGPERQPFISLLKVSERGRACVHVHAYGAYKHVLIASDSHRQVWVFMG